MTTATERQPITLPPLDPSAIEHKEEEERGKLITLDRSALPPIRTKEDLDAEDDYLRRIKRLQKETRERFDRITKPMDTAKREALELRRQAEAPLEKEATVCSARILEANSWFEDQARIAREEAERKRREEERRRKEEAEADAALTEQLADDLLEEAAEAEANGDHVRAQQLLEEAAPDYRAEAPAVSAPIVKAEEKVEFSSGSHVRRIRKWRLVDISKVAPKFLTVDKKAVDRLVKAAPDDEEAVRIVGGISVYYDETVVTR